MTDPTIAAPVAAEHEAAARELPFDDAQDFEDAERGFLGTLDPCVIRTADGVVVWDATTFDFLAGDAPESVHPSLWRQSLLVQKHGLFEVVPGIYQVRGLDLSNVTFLETDTGVLVVDPLISTETAAAALGLYRAHRGDRPVVAVLYTHSHIDHFGGVLGVVDPEDVAAGRVPVIAPEGFLEHAVAENVHAGVAMARRAGYMYGAALPRGPRGSVGAGLGQTTSIGTVGLIPPTVEIRTTGERLVVDGLELVFQMAPGSEAPAELHFHLPSYRALCIAENATHTLHNLLTLRGALVRDPKAWAGYLTEAIATFADTTDVVFASHHWPTWGAERIVEYLSTQRDIYAYLHDETLRMLNRGMQGAEIAERIELPPALERAWSVRGYYGSVSHNVKAIYQRYMGWFDGNPVHLWEHPPKPLAERYVAALGGADRVLELAAAAVDAGDLRWAATLLGHAVFDDESNELAKARLADVLEQLGFLVENATWRNFYLSGALELREGSFGTPTQSDSRALSLRVPTRFLLEALAIAIVGPMAWDLDLALGLVVTDEPASFRLRLSNGVLTHRAAEPEPGETRVTLTRARLLALLAGDTQSPGLEIDGDPTVLATLLAVAEPGDPGFAIVTP